MASENQSFPQIPASVWWSLRKRLHQSLPKEISIGYLETALGLGPAAAKKYLYPLKKLGLVGEDGKATERANKWRGDQHGYEEACKEIIEEIFPHELNDAIANPRDERNNITKWFMNKLRIGQPVANSLANFYIMLREADLSNETEGNGSPKAKPESKIKSNPIPKAIPKPNIAVSNIPQPLETPNQSKESRFTPKIHIDVQIHISPESTADQIDQIFASMAKHLGNFNA